MATTITFSITLHSNLPIEVVERQKGPVLYTRTGVLSYSG